MNRINPHTLDLNLLRMLLAVAETGSVSEAAKLVGLSQPAASNSLGRLRDAMGDPLFVRTRNGMIPTPFASDILPGVQRQLSGIYETLGDRAEFAPKSSRRTFRLSLSGLGELVFLTRLAETVFLSAPDVRLFNHSVPLDRIADALEDGKIECAIGIINIQGRGIKTHPLFTEDYAVIAGAGLKSNPKTLGELQNERIVVSAPVISFANDLADILKANELSQNVALQLANFGALPHLLEKLPFAAIVPRQYAHLLEVAGQARSIKINLQQPEAVARLVWNERTDADEACRWLRNCIIEDFSTSKDVAES